MPYILVSRTDIDAGVLQSALDLHPNTVQRRFPYELVGQTGYRNQALPGSAPSITAGVTDEASAGLASWFLDNVSAGTGTAATATITTVAVASLLDGETFTVSDGESTVTFEFIVTAGGNVASPNVAVDVSGDTSADDVRDTILGVIPGVLPNVGVVSGGAGQVDLTNNHKNQTLAQQNNTDNDETVANGTFAITDFTGATTSPALTGAEAEVNAQDVIDELLAGNALDLASLNAAITTGTLVPGQEVDILDILAGRAYNLPAGVTLEAGGSFIAGGGSLSESFRRLYEAGAFRISFSEGRLYQFANASFTFKGVQGAAVTVYADDGSLYV